MALTCRITYVLFILLLCYRRNGIDLVLNTKVKAVNRNSVMVADNSGHERDIPFGACVWATGVAMHPLIKQVNNRVCV